MIEQPVEHQRSYKFLRLRWQEGQIALYTKYANLICIVLMLLAIPTDFLSFPQSEAWTVVRIRCVAIAVFLGNLVLGELFKRRPQWTHAFMLLLIETMLTINVLYLYFLLSMEPQHRLAVTTGCLTAIFGTHLFVYRFQSSHMAFTVVHALLLAIPFSLDDQWRSYLISILLGHGTSFIITLFFGRVFYDSLEKDYVIKLQADAIKKQAEQIESDLKDKNNLVKILVHDIATPLTVIEIDASSLNEKNSLFDEVTRKRLGRIHNASTAISDLIKHVREFETVRTGKKALRVEPCSVNECLDGALLMIEARAKAKKVSIVTLEGLHDDLYCMAEAVNLTHQVLVNILSNSVKYSDPGDTIDIRLRSEGNLVQITIRDHGRGMPKSILDDLFSSSRPTSRPGTEGEKGTGFGMPLAKAYIERFNGDIKVDSTTAEEKPGDHGTTVVLRLPRVV